MTRRRRTLVRLCPVAAALLALGTAGCAAPPGPNAPPAAVTAEHVVVDWVGDGDSLRLADGREVRLLQIDAPELHGDCYGRAALLALRRLTPHGTRIGIVTDPQLDQQDGYGRLLRYVFAGRRNVGVALVRSGAASPYFFRQRRGRYAAALLDAVDEARTAHRGYWQACRGARLDVRIGSVTGRG
jgi:endonuclease YncB( thermonuclease family)